MASENKIDWYRCDINRDKLKELTQKQNIIPIIHIIANLGLLVITGTAAYLCYLYLNWVVFIAALYIHCMFVNFLYSPNHEMMHKTPFKNTRINEFFYKICAFMLWSNFTFVRASHMKHHQLTVFKGRDYEIPMPRIYKTWQWLFLWTFLPVTMCLVPGMFSAIATNFRFAFGKMKGYWENFVVPETEPNKRKQVYRDSRIILGGHLILIAIFLFTGAWPLILIVNFAVFFAAGLGQLVGMPQHIALKHSVPDFRICCRTIMLNPFLRFLYWNMNYHIEHHMYAAVPYHKLPKLRKTIQDDLPTAKTGLWDVWVNEIIPAMKKQRKDPDYCIVQDVPNPKMV